MEWAVLEVSLCLIENVIIYLFLNSLLKKAFNSPLPLIIAIVINSAANYFCSNLNMFLKVPLAVICLAVSTSILYKDKLIIKLSYILTSIYFMYIVDIIIGNIISLVLGKDIVGIFFADFLCRLISCLLIKAVDVFIFVLLKKMLSKADKNLRNKFWLLFLAVVFVFLVISTVFLQIYPMAYQDSQDAVLYTSLAVLFLAMSMIIIYFFIELSRGIQRDSKLFLLENNFSSLQEQIAVQQQNGSNFKKMRHDVKNHLANIRALIVSGDIQDAVTLLDQTAENVNNAKGDMIDTGNSFVDAILLSKTAICREKGIDFTYSIQPLEDIKIDAIDLSSLLSNLLDNAVESAVQTSEPFIKLTIMKYNAYYTICAENSYKGKEFLNESAGTLITTKTDRALHGYGTQIISDIAQKYDGNYLWEARDNKFVSTLLVKI